MDCILERDGRRRVEEDVMSFDGKAKVKRGKAGIGKSRTERGSNEPIYSKMRTTLRGRARGA